MNIKRKLLFYISMDRNLEIRKVPPKAMYELIQILECGNDWKKLMSIVPKSNLEGSLKYNYHHVKSIEDAGIVERRPCAQIFMEEWGTSGKKQPTLQVLKELLLKAQLFRAAEYVAVQLLKESAPTRPDTGPAAAVDISEETIIKLIDLNEKFKKRSHLTNETNTGLGNKGISRPGWVNENSPKSVAAHDSSKDGQNTLTSSSDNRLCSDEQSTEDNVFVCDSLRSNTGPILEHIPYSELQTYTDNFCERPLIGNFNKGRKLGTGGFGSVYLGILPSSIKVAVKRLKNDAINVDKQFKNEVDTLSKYQHPNLLSLLKYSYDGPHYCLVYAYMSNGSLQDRLALKGSTVLQWKKRFEIALGTARGILYLHSAYETPLIHRDIKSANILLDEDLTPKLGDFGLVRLGTSGQQSIAVTTTVFGTSAYMAPEAFRGDISVKLDSFSFGVVLLELLTSLPPYDEKREGCDLVTHIEDICEKSIEPLLDIQAGSWGINHSTNPSEILYSIAKNCLKERRQRPTMNVVLEDLHKLIDTVSEVS